NAIAPVLPTEEPEYSLSMGYEHPSTTPETESDKVIESSVKNLVQIPSEYEVNFDNESECDVPVKNESSPVCTTFANPLFDCNDDFTSSDDELLSNKDVPMENFKVYSNTLFLMMEKSILIIWIRIYSMSNLILLNLSKELNAEIADTIVESLSPSPIPIEDSDYLMDEIDLFLATDDLLPPGIESDDYDSEGDIHFLEELLSDDSISLPKNESSNSDHQDDPSFPRPPLEPPDVKFFCDFEHGLRELIAAVMNNIDELNEDECFDPGGEIHVFENIKDDDYFTFIFFIRIFLPYLIHPEVSPLLFSAGSEDTIFDPGISI
nr:hypothetical protein [Tanacetum cinerariifolium]